MIPFLLMLNNNIRYKGCPKSKFPYVQKTPRKYAKHVKKLVLIR